MAKELCQDCGCVFEPKSNKGMICPECHKKRLSRYAKERNLNKLGNDAYSEQQAIRRKERGRMIDKFYKQICPFCRKDHEQRLHINIICHCGAKYYFNRGKWLNRQTGEWIWGEAIEIYEKKVRFDDA